MITSVLLTIIYLSFISLGLPDSILGVSIPAMQGEWGFPLSFGGAISMIIVGGSIISSFSSSFVIRRIGTGKVTFASCLLTAAALFGFSVTPSYMWLIFLAVPLGLGGGSVDAALNNYVALHFKAHHMNWLHSFWGVGATLGPVLMSFFIASSSSWRSGYRTISIIQFLLASILLLTLPLWKKHRKITGFDETAEYRKERDLRKKAEEDFQSEVLNDYSDNRDNADSVNRGTEDSKKAGVLKIRGVKYAFLTFLFYCAVEHSVGLWGSSYLVKIKNAPLEEGAFWMAFYYGGITAGRFLSGFFSFYFTNPQMIRYGLLTAFTGSLLLYLPLPSLITGCSFVFIGLGLSPVFPAMLHETPLRFGKEKSQDIIGFQMGFGYTGSAFLPLLLGIVLQSAGMSYFPVFVTVMIGVIIIVSGRIDKVLKRGN